MVTEDLAGQLGWLDSVAPATATVPPALPDPGADRIEELRLAPGTVLGRYVVLEPLGSGGMGVVHAAFDRTLNRRVALKVLRRSEQTAQAEDRLLAEAQALARLAHPNVVAVYDAGRLEGLLVLALELVEGENLASWLRSRPRSWRQILDAFLDAGRGLEAAHAAGLAHRDIKPGNLVIGHDGRARVVDFGLARPSPSEPSSDGAAPPAEPASPTTASRPGSLIGTPAFMAPEQFLGQPADALSDQFSFAVALYDGLYGEHPFAGETATERREAVLAGRLRPAPAHPAAPLWIRRALLRALAPEPGDRYPGLGELLAALRRDPARLRRRRWLLVAGAALTAALGAGASLWQRTREARCTSGAAELDEVWNPALATSLGQRFAATGVGYAAAAARAVTESFDRYGLAWVESRNRICRATQIDGTQSAALMDLKMACLERRRQELRALAAGFAEPAQSLGAEAVERAPDAAASLASLADCSRDDLVLARARPPADEPGRTRLADIERLLAEAPAQLALGRTRDSLELARQASAQARDLGYRPAEGEALYLEGRLLDELGELDAAQQAFEAGFAAAEAGGDDALRVRLALHLAFLHAYDRNQFAEGRRWLELAGAVVERTGKPPELAALLARSEAAHAFVEGRYEDAVKLGREAVSQVQKAFGPEALEAVEVANNLGQALFRLRRFDEAREAYAQGLAISRRRFGAEHPMVTALLSNDASALDAAGQLEQALAQRREVLARCRLEYPPEHPAIARELSLLGHNLQRLGRYDEARPYLLEAIERQQKVAGGSTAELAAMYNRLGFGLRQQERYREALEAYQQSLALFARDTPAEHPAWANPLIGAGLSELGLHRLPAALAHLRRAYEIRRRGQTAPQERASAAFALARATAAAGDLSHGRELAREALELYRQAGAGVEADRRAVELWLAKGKP